MLPNATPPATLAAVQALWSGAALADPYPGYERLRALGQGGVLAVPEWNAAFVTGHAANNAVLRSPAARSGVWLNGPDAPATDATALLRPMMLFHNGASHARLRSLVQAAFTPRVVEEQRALVRATLEGLLDGMAGRGEADVVADLATPLPVRVIMSMLGLSGEDEARFLRWSLSVAELIGGAAQSPELLARIGEDAREMREFFRDLADELRGSPQPGLLSALAAVEDVGLNDGSQRLSGDELLSNAVLLLAAGHETTSNLIAGGLVALARQPGAWAALVERPDHPGVADELLRFVSPVQLDGRTLDADLTLGGQTLRAGTQVQLLLAAANRDPAVFADPGRLDWERPGGARHLAFAAGPHYCLGASLARLEIAETFGTLARRFPRLEVLDERPTYKPNFVLRGPAALRVRLGAAG